MRTKRLHNAVAGNQMKCQANLFINRIPRKCGLHWGINVDGQTKSIRMWCICTLERK